MKFTDLRVKTKLMLGFAAVAAIVLLVSALSLRSLGASNDRFSSCFQISAPVGPGVRGCFTRLSVSTIGLPFELLKGRARSADDGDGTNASSTRRSRSRNRARRRPAPPRSLPAVACLPEPDRRSIRMPAS